MIPNVAAMSNREFNLQYFRALRDFLVQDFYKYLRLNQKGKLKNKIRFICFNYDDLELVIIRDKEVTKSELTKHGYKVFTLDKFYYKNPFNPNDTPYIDENGISGAVYGLYMDLRLRYIENK